jgi:hypothetical protein
MFANLLEPLLSSIIRVPKACWKINKRRDEGKSGKGRRTMRCFGSQMYMNLLWKMHKKPI